jgi:homoserine kinase type II
MMVFLLQHARTTADGSEDVKIIGIYSSEDTGRAAIARLASVKGFARGDGEFTLDAYELDRDHWTEGFLVGG